MKLKEKDLEDPENRLTLYKDAIEDFKLDSSRIINGFCHYMRKTYKIEVYNDNAFEKLLPELFLQKPDHISFLYWVTPGDKSRRIGFLKEAIKLLKKNNHE